MLDTIDCDFHPALASTRQLLPYLDDYWREMIVVRNIDRLDLTSYPPGAEIFSRPDWRGEHGPAGSDLCRVQSDLLDHFEIRYAIANVLHGAQAMYNEYIGAALCSAINDWLVAEWLDLDNRLRASIVVSIANPEMAATEIERLAHDRRFVQVLMLAMGETPLGRRQYWPIYAAAERHGLPIGIHAGSMYRHAPTQCGFPSYLIEDYAAQSQGFAAQVLSFIAEGVFAKYPGLKVVLIESGVSWMPSLMWRCSKDWLGARIEIPWVKSSPAALIRTHFRMTMHPFDGPPEAADVERLINQFGSDDMFLFSSDYPHWQFSGDEALPRGLPRRLIEKLLLENALNTYPRLAGGKP